MRKAVRNACLQAALNAFEDARMRGLCCEGAWECAIGAIQELDVNNIMTISIKRAYAPPSDDDGCRVLVDRVWPRGRKESDLKLGRWCRSIAPSIELRRWFNHDPAKWAEFKKKYFAELREHQDELHDLLEAAGTGPLTLVYGARDERHNNAVALREYLQRMTRR